MSENDKPRFSAGQAEPAPQQANPGIAPVEATGRRLNLDDLFNPTATAARGGVVVTRVKEILEEIAKDFATKTNNVKQIYVCIADQDPLRIPAVVLYSVNQNEILSYPLILEACGEKLEPKQVPGQGGKLISIDMPTARYFTGTMQSICETRVLADAQSRGLVKQARVVTINGVVIKNGVNLEEKKALAPYFDSAVAAITAMIRASMKLTTCDMTADMLTSKAIQMVSRNRITPGATDVDAFGNVVAQDFRIEMVARQADQRANDDPHTTGREAVISSVSGYIDFAYATPDNQQQQQARIPGNMNPIPAYSPYMVITNASALGASTTLGDNLLTQCFALASVAGLAADMRWASVFTRSGMDSGKKASIGAFALEHDPFQIKPENPRILNVAAGFEPVLGTDSYSPLEIIQKFCYPTMVVAMDIEQGGPMSWVQAVFANAAPGSQMEDLICRELDRFSNGAWSQIWDRRQPILAYNSVQVHLGHYPTPEGGKRDIRSIDYLTMLTLCNGDYSVMGPYAEGFTPGRDTPEVLNAKRDILKSFSAVEFTGMATRIFFNTNFINALEQMFTAVGLRINLEGISDILGIGGRTTAFGGQFNTAVIGHGAFQQNFGATPIVNNTNYFGGYGLAAARY